MGTVDHQYLRPIKGRCRQATMEEPFPCREALTVWQGQNAVIYPLREVPGDELLFGRGGVADRDGNYIELSGIAHRVSLTYPYENPDYRDEKVVYCGYLVPHWGHFLIEGVTRLWYFLKNDPTIDKYVFFIEEGSEREITGNFREFLELMGIWEHLEIINKPTVYREVLVPEKAYQGHTYFSESFRAIFDRVSANVTPDPSWAPHDRIYFSRSKFRKNGELEEYGYEGLDNYFERNGYLILYPESTPLSQLIYYIRSSREVATLSGSVQHNMLFAQNGHKLIVLERCVPNDVDQIDVDRIRELNAVYIDANISLYTVDFGGPFIMGYNENLRRFSEDNGYLPPDSQYLTEKYRRRCLSQYMQSYWNQYRYRWFMLDWYCTCADFLLEAYEDGYAYFKPYIDGEKPIFWYQRLYPHYIKQFIKQLLGRLGLYR